MKYAARTIDLVIDPAPRCPSIRRGCESGRGECSTIRIVAVVRRCVCLCESRSSLDRPGSAGRTWRIRIEARKVSALGIDDRRERASRSIAPPQSPPSSSTVGAGDGAKSAASASPEVAAFLQPNRNIFRRTLVERWPRSQTLLRDLESRKSLARRKDLERKVRIEKGKEEEKRRNIRERNLSGCLDKRGGSTGEISRDRSTGRKRKREKDIAVFLSPSGTGKAAGGESGEGKAARRVHETRNGGENRASTVASWRFLSGRRTRSRASGMTVI